MEVAELLSTLQKINTITVGLNSVIVYNCSTQEIYCKLCYYQVEVSLLSHLEELIMDTYISLNKAVKNSNTSKFKTM